MKLSRWRRTIHLYADIQAVVCLIVLLTIAAWFVQARPFEENKPIEKLCDLVEFGAEKTRLRCRHDLLDMLDDEPENYYLQAKLEEIEQQIERVQVA